MYVRGTKKIRFAVNIDFCSIYLKSLSFKGFYEGMILKNSSFFLAFFKLRCNRSVLEIEVSQMHKLKRS